MAIKELKKDADLTFTVEISSVGGGRYNAEITNGGDSTVSHFNVAADDIVAIFAEEIRTELSSAAPKTAVIRGYKGFDFDSTSFDGFRYKIKAGQTYEMDDSSCSFHFCRNVAEVFKHYKGRCCRYAEVEAYGRVVYTGDGSFTNKLRIVRELTYQEMMDLSNSGIYNSGVCNTGDCNAGDNNSGEYNTGDYNAGSFCLGNWNTGNCNSGSHNAGDNNSGEYNTGDYNAGEYNTGDNNSGSHNTGDNNSGEYNTGDFNAGEYNTGSHNAGNHNAGNHNAGDYNTGDYNVANHSTGFFNTVDHPLMMFDNPCGWTAEQFRSSNAAKVLSLMPSAYTCTAWVSERDMIPGGYLVVKDHKVDRQAWWDGLDGESKAAVMQLPNFDREKFHTCTGIWA